MKWRAVMIGIPMPDDSPGQDAGTRPGVNRNLNLSKNTARQTWSI